MAQSTNPLRPIIPGAPSAPSPGTPGEGWGEGDLELWCSLVLEITLTPALSRGTGRGSKFTADRGTICAKRNKRFIELLQSL
jgi:hypothetical protein